MLEPASWETIAILLGKTDEELKTILSGDGYLTAVTVAFKLSLDHEYTRFTKEVIKDPTAAIDAASDLLGVSKDHVRNAILTYPGSTNYRTRSFDI